MKVVVEEQFSGIVSVIKEGRSIINNAYGYRDYPNEIANNPETLFEIASGSKTFVAVAILQLIQDGKISLNQKVSEIFENSFWPFDKNVTVRMLLNHSSGIPDYFDEEENDDYASLWKECPNYRIRCNQEVFSLFRELPMKEQPGSTFRYNNSGYIVLAAIIEKITNQLFDEYIQEHIFDKVGMARSGYYELDRLPKNTANAYLWDEKQEKYYSNIYSIDVKGTGAGGGYSNGEEIARFWQGVFNGTLLSKELLEKMIANQTKEKKNRYGYGVYLLEKEGAQIPCMVGVDPGITFISSHIAEIDLTITIISNFEQSIRLIHQSILGQVWEEYGLGE